MHSCPAYYSDDVAPCPGRRCAQLPKRSSPHQVGRVGGDVAQRAVPGGLVGAWRVGSCPCAVRVSLCHACRVTHRGAGFLICMLLTSRPKDRIFPPLRPPRDSRPNLERTSPCVAPDPPSQSCSDTYIRQTTCRPSSISYSQRTLPPRQTLVPGHRAHAMARVAGVVHARLGGTDKIW